MKQNINNNHKKPIIIRIILVFLVLLVMSARFYHKDYFSVFLCVLTLMLFNVPVVINRKLNIELPHTLEIIILLFIFSAEILGEIGSFYTYIKWWDTMLHTLNGFIMAGIGFSLIDILNNNPRFHITMSPVFVAFVAFCFSMTVGVVWEFFEFSLDMLIKTDTQNDFIVKSISSIALNPKGINDPIRINGITDTVVNYVKNGERMQYIIEGGYLDIGIIDTMKDLIVNCIGAIVFSIIGYFYIIGRNKGIFIRKFIPRLKESRHTK